MRCGWLVLAVVGLYGDARADDAPVADPVAEPAGATPDVETLPETDPLVQQGQDLARQGEFTHAIELFKQAEAKHPRAANACLIGLVYLRRELWTQAEIFFERCQRAGTANDASPEWLPAAREQLAKKLTEIDVATIEIHVEPPKVGALVTVSSFPPDETFEPRTIHLTQGSYTIVARAPGRDPASAPITVGSRAQQIVTLVLPAPPPPPPPPTPRATTMGNRVLLVSAGVAVVGGLVHVLAYHERNLLQDARGVHDPVAYDASSGTFDATRAVAIGCYGVAVIGVVAGMVLRHRGSEQAVSITAGVGAGGTATVGVEWHR